MPDSDPFQALLQQLAKHFVGLLVLDEDHEPAPSDSVSRLQIFSGFLVSVRGVWFIATAGHVLLEGLKQEVFDRDREITRAHLYVGWALPRDKGEGLIPFHYDPSKCWAIDDAEKGLDYALIPLSDYYREHLKVLGMIPLNESTWNFDASTQFDTFVLVGLPGEKVVGTQIFPRGRVPHGIMTSLSMIFLETTDSPPDVLRRSNQRFYAKIAAPAQPTVDGEFSIDDIKGMSGGPIFGFSPTNDGQHRIYVVGVQSSWEEDSRVIAACPIGSLLAQLEEGWSKIDKERGADA